MIKIISLFTGLFLLFAGYAQSEGCEDKVTKYKKGEKVDLIYSNKWYDATIVDVVGEGQYIVHYDGWGDNWDETVCNDRLQARTEKSESTGPVASGGHTTSSSNTDKIGTIKLHNQCSHSSVMRVGDKDYEIGAFKHIEVEIKDNTRVSTLINGSPKHKELYFYDSKVITFYAMCD